MRDLSTLPSTTDVLLSSLIQEERESIGSRVASSDGFNLTTYHDYYEVLVFMNNSGPGLSDSVHILDHGAPG